MSMESEYNNRARVPEHPEIFTRWTRDAEAYRAAVSEENCGTFDQVYGPGERQQVDIFWPKLGVRREGAPWVVFLHGGYWQAMNRKVFSHFARGLNGRGLVVAIPSYTLCPEVSMRGLVEGVRRCCAHLYAQTQGAGIILCGHSAGGHLMGLLMSSSEGEPEPEVGVRAGVGLSSVFDLSPLLETGLNGALRLDTEEAQNLSPIHWMPVQNKPVIAAVGGDESGEFLRQSRDFAEMWRRRGAAIRYWEIPGANHFTIVDPLSDPGSALVDVILGLAMG